MNITLVSVVDNNLVHINSLLVLFTSLFKIHPNLDSTYLLTFPGNLSDRYINYFRMIGVQVLTYNMEDFVMEDDPYRAKYLLKYFIEEAPIKNSHVLYLDPDHIVLNEVILDETNTMYVSSEVKNITDTFLITSNYDIHYNTSIIFSRVEILKKVTENWLEQYDQIKNRIDVRFREEIAMGLATKLSKIDVRPFEQRIQCTIDSLECKSIFCHYGGTSSEAQYIKSCLNHEGLEDVVGELSNLISYNTNYSIQYIGSFLIKHLSIVRQFFV